MRTLYLLRVLKPAEFAKYICLAINRARFLFFRFSCELDSQERRVLRLFFSPFRIVRMSCKRFDFSLCVKVNLRGRSLANSGKASSLRILRPE